jgi:hypothetical protein
MVRCCKICFVKGKGKVVLVNAMEAYGSRGIVPCILSLSTRWRWEVRFMPQPLYFKGKNTSSPWIGGWIGPELFWALWKSEKSLAAAGVRDLLRQHGVFQGLMGPWIFFPCDLLTHEGEDSGHFVLGYDVSNYIRQMEPSPTVLQWHQNMHVLLSSVFIGLPLHFRTQKCLVLLVWR